MGDVQDEAELVQNNNIVVSKKQSSFLEKRKSHSFDHSTAMILIDTTAINTDSYLQNMKP